MSSPQPPPVDPREVKPGRFWYWIAAGIIVLFLAAGAGVFVVGLSSAVASVPDLKPKADIDSPSTVELTAGSSWAIYVEAPGETTPLVDCGVESDDGTALMAPADATFRYSAGGETWHLVYEVTIEADGEYTFTCDTDDAVDGFAVGEAADVGGLMGGVFGGIGGLLGIGCFGLVIGGVIILVVAMRRSGSRKALRNT